MKAWVVSARVDGGQRSRAVSPTDRERSNARQTKAECNECVISDWSEGSGRMRLRRDSLVSRMYPLKELQNCVLLLKALQRSAGAAVSLAFSRVRGERDSLDACCPSGRSRPVDSKGVALHWRREVGRLEVAQSQSDSD